MTRPGATRGRARLRSSTPSWAVLVGLISLTSSLLVAGPAGAHPPLIAPAHPGPTALASSRLAPAAPVATSPLREPGPREEGPHAPRGYGRTSGEAVPTIRPYSWETGWWTGGWPGNGTTLLGEGGAFLSDDLTNNITVFGGFASGGLGNYTLEYNATIYNWSLWWLTSGASPSARANMSYVSDENLGVGVIFGGLTDLAGQVVANDTWSYTFANQSWTNVTGGAHPSARESAAMAIDTVDHLALLEGGADPSYHAGNSTGAVYWNDTWLLNLTTMTWSQLALVGGPAPQFGATMVFDPVNATYYLFGGCGATCSGAVWSYRLGESRWYHVATNGVVIRPRASPAFEWDPHQDVATLFGGFAPGAQGPVVYGDTYTFDPSTATWTYMPFGADPPNGAPTPLYDPTVGEPEEANCAGMWVWSGSNALLGPPPYTWVLQSPSPPSPNCYVPILPNGTNSPPPTCPPAATLLDLSVVDNGSGEGLDGALVQFTGPCTPPSYTTGPGGENLIEVTAGIGWNISVTDSGYFPLRIHYTAPNATSAKLVIRIVPLPVATIHCWGRNGTSLAYPLPGVAVTLDGSIVLGMCDATGQLGPLRLPYAGGFVTFSGTDPGYSGANDTVLTPANQMVFANLTLKESAPLRIHVIRGTDGSSVAGAAGTLTSIDLLSVDPVKFVTNDEGWFNLTIGGANYTVEATAPGLAPVHFGPALHPWTVTTTWTIVMGPPGGMNVSVRLVDRSNGASIVGGTVYVAPDSTGTTDSGGIARFAAIGPPGPAEVVGSANGFYSATTLIILAPSGTHPLVVLQLNRTSPCLGPAPCAARGNTSLPPFHLLPTGGSALELLEFTPGALVAAAAIAFLARRSWPERLAPNRPGDHSGHSPGV